MRTMHFFACKVLPLCLVMACSTAVCSELMIPHPKSCAVKIRGESSESAEEIARRNGFRNLGKIGNLEDVYLFQVNGHETEPRLTRGRARDGDTVIRASPQPARQDQLQAEESVDYVIEQKVHQRTQRLSYTPPSDPKWTKQWSLLNRGQVGGSHDLNVEPVWIQGLTGRGVTVAVVDDGLWYTHPDLNSNFKSELSWDFVDNDDDVMPRRTRDNHGTSCAGIVAMVKSNGVCGVGVAHESQIAGLRILDRDETTDAIEARALGFNTESIDIYVNSWGPYDNGFTVDGPGPLLTNVLQKGAEEGRGGKGAIYVWASGNGGMDGDTCAMDGYVASIYTIAIGSVDQDGMQAPYDEDCPSKMAVTSNHNARSHKKNNVVTTDARDKCRQNFRGTSAASPLLSGVIALALQANNNLTWRDVQYLIVHTSDHSGLTSRNGQQWTLNGAGLWVSQSFGFGAIDAEAMVTRSRHWANVPEQKQMLYEPDFGSGVADINNTLRVFFAVGNDSEIRSLEHVTVRVSLAIENYTVPYSLTQYNIMQTLFGIQFEQTDIDNLLWHTGARRGHIQISLRSPHGTESILLPYRENDFVNSDNLEWSFMSVLHWGENPLGEWSVVVNFKSGEGYVQMLGLNVTFYGISEDSVASVSEDCSPQCRGKCAKNNSLDHCDTCWYYRDTESLTCLDYCDNSSYEQYQNYCIPLQVHEDSIHITPSTDDLYTLIPNSLIVNPTALTSCTVFCASSFTTKRPKTDHIMPTATTWPSLSNFTSCSPETRIHMSQLSVHFTSPVTTLGDVRYSSVSGKTADLSRIAPSAVSDPVVGVATIHSISSTPTSPPYHTVTSAASSTLWPTAVISLSVCLYMSISTIFY